MDFFVIFLWICSEESATVSLPQEQQILIGKQCLIWRRLNFGLTYFEAVDFEDWWRREDL